MKVSLNLAQEYSNVDLKSIPRDELLARIGAQLGAVEDVVDWAPKFDGAVIAKVVTCDKHPDADKLSVCRIDDGGLNQAVERGEDGLIQVVCGAPNVRAGMYAVWLAPGVVVPSTRDTDPFTLEVREIRGVVSSGMLASASELGISDDHNGIVDITADDAGREPVPGEPLTSYFGLDDFVIDCENKMFTHRPDCFGVLGVARELAGINGLKFQSPDWYKEPDANTEGPFSELELQSKCETTLVPRFTARVIEGVSIHASPMWLQATLARLGLKSINNVVDWTNYYMHLTGQPTHAFDYDKVKALSGDVPTIFPRLAQAGETLTVLGGKVIELHEGDLVIATDKQPIALAGIIGGADTEVDENTKNIIIECATFDMYSIRRSSMRHGLFTDASNRFNKGQSPYQNLRVLHKLVKDIVASSDARQGKVIDIIDCDNVDTSEAGLTSEVRLNTGFINDRLGSKLSSAEIKLLLENVEFVVEVTGEDLHVHAPFWRMDIEQPEDVVEEVGRLYGYDKLPTELPKRSAKPAKKNPSVELKNDLRGKLAQAGANEVLTYSFVHGDLLKKTGIDAEQWTYHIRNAISPDLQYYRPSLMPSLLAKVHSNIKSQAGRDDNQFALFEIGKAHVKGHQDSDGLPGQMERLALVVAADDKTANLNQAGSAYYLAKKYLDRLANGQASTVPLENFEYPVTAPYAAGRSAMINIGQETVGVIGEFSPSVRRALKLPEFCAGFELDIELLGKLLKASEYQSLPEFPGTSKDYTHEVASDVSWHKVKLGLEQVLSDANSEKGYVFSIEPLDIFEPEDGDIKRLTLRINLHHPSKTMTSEEATRFVDEATARMQQIETEEA